MHEHIARTMYYLSIHLLYASIVGSAAWVLTSIRQASATTKYWIWVVTAFNFFVPTGAVVDKLGAPLLAWATPLGAIGDSIWSMTQGRTALVLAVVWIAGSFAMLMRLMSRIHKERKQTQASIQLVGHDVNPSFIADGIPVTFGNRHPSPSVCGVLSPHILLPSGIVRLLNEREFEAVLLHELAHARRRDNLIRLLYELALCVLWFHPLIWVVGLRMALYRELSCDESVIRRAHGQALISALAKLAVPEQPFFLQATASSHLSCRLARLLEPVQTTHRAVTLVTALVFAGVIVAGVLGTVAHTACCFVPTDRRVAFLAHPRLPATSDYHSDE